MLEGPVVHQLCQRYIQMWKDLMPGTMQAQCFILAPLNCECRQNKWMCLQ